MLVSTLINALKFVIPFSAQKDEVRTQIKGVQFVFVDDRTLRLSATNGYEIARLDVDMISETDERLISKETCKAEIEKTGDRENEYFLSDECVKGFIKTYSDKHFQRHHVQLSLPDPKEKKMIFSIAETKHLLTARKGVSFTGGSSANDIIEKPFQRNVMDKMSEEKETDDITITRQSETVYKYLSLACKHILDKKAGKYTVRVEQAGAKKPTVYRPVVSLPYKEAVVVSMPMNP